MLQVSVGTSWRAMVPELCASIRDTLDSPFATGRVLVATPGSARLLSQAMAEVDGIAAGVEVLTPAQLVGRVAGEGASSGWEAWRSPRLTTAVLESLDEVAAAHRLLAAHLARPGRDFGFASRIASLFRALVLHAPATASAWIEGRAGDEVPEHLRWQPELLRAVVSRLGHHPVEALEGIAKEIAEQAVPTWLFTLDELAEGHVGVVEAAKPKSAWFVGEAPAWVAALPHDEPRRTGKPLRATPKVEIHGAHGPLRQAEVLRDELTRALEDDPSLEPRDVLVVCPEPEAWSPVLDAVFRAGGRHPGKALRVADVAVQGAGNHALDALLAALELVDGRATATQVVDVLTLPGFAHRWGFREQREDLVELVSAARIRWGLDPGHRARYGLGAVPLNTWSAGVDALFTGIAMGGEHGPQQVTGVAGTSSNDLPLLGALAEVLGRLYGLLRATEEPLPVEAWCTVAEEALEGLVGLPSEDRWMVQGAATVLAQLARAHAGATATLSRRAFRLLLAEAVPSRWHRPALGNGNLHVVTPSEARQVDRRLTVFLGLTDGSGGAAPDEIPGLLPDARARQLRHLLEHARASGRLMVVAQTRSERTGAPRELPVAIRYLLRQLGSSLPEIVQHAPQASNRSEFLGEGSFDAAAHEGALVAHEHLPSAKLERRRAALARPVDEAPAQVTLTELRSFLTDPVKPFLRHILGVRWYDAPALSDELPLGLRSLESWALTDAFLEGRLRHVEPAVLLERARQSQLLPPGALGDALADEAGRKAEEVVDFTARYTTEPPRTVPLSVELDGTQLTGTASLHGDQLVVPCSSSTTKALLEPWLQLLMLAVQGERTRAVVIRPTKRKGARSNTLMQPTPELAREWLGRFVRAHRIGRSRLLPVPFEPAFRLAMETHRGRFQRSQWTNPNPRDWSKWSYPDPLWSLFYDRPAVELLDDAPQPEDPPGDGASTFERWAVALYDPLIQKGGSW